MASASRNRWQLKQQAVAALLLLTVLWSDGNRTVLAVPSSYSSRVSGTNAEGSTALQIIAIIPTIFGPGDPQWTKGDEILAGAYVAIKEINEISDLLSGYQLQVLPVRVPQCELSEGIVPYVEELTSNCNIISVVGYFCHNLVRYLSPLAHYWAVIQILATSLEDSCNDNHIAPHLQHSILPVSESIASAIVQLLRVEQECSCKQPKSKFCGFKRAFLKSAKDNSIY